MPRKPIPELPPDAPELHRADDICPECKRPRCQPGQQWQPSMCGCDVPVNLPDPAKEETMTLTVLSDRAGPHGQVIVPEHRDSLRDQYRRAEAMLAQGSSPINVAPSNIDRTTPLGKALLIASGNPGDIEMGADKVVRIKATHYVLYPDRGTDEETGEVRLMSRLVLIDAAGRTFRTTAQHGPDRLAAILSLYTPEEWAAGIPLIIRARPSKRKGRSDWHDIRIDMEELTGGG